MWMTDVILKPIITGKHSEKRKTTSTCRGLGCCVAVKDVVGRRSITIPQRSPLVEGSTELLQEHRSVSQLCDLTSWSCQANATGSKRLSQICPLITLQ